MTWILTNSIDKEGFHMAKHISIISLALIFLTGALSPVFAQAQKKVVIRIVSDTSPPAADCHFHELVPR